MRLVSWNIHMGAGGKTDQQVEVLKSLSPDVVALQEMSPRIVEVFRQGLHSIGLEYELDTYRDLATQADRRWKYGELIASRWPLVSIPPSTFDIPWPERLLSATASTPWGPIEFHNVHIPSGWGSGIIKIETFEGVQERLAQSSAIPRVLCGDFNSPKKERPDGQVLVWGQYEDSEGTIQVEKGEERWVAGERSVIVDLAQYDLPDAFRAVNGYELVEVSWYHHGNARFVGRRYDHVFASKSLNPVEARYIHSAREAGLSDHAPILVRFEPGVVAPVERTTAKDG